MKRAALPLIVTLLTIVAAAPAHAGLAANVDLAVLRVTTNVSSASVGQRLVFRAVAKNLGPDAVPDGDSFDVQYVDAVNIRVKAEHCIIPGLGEVVSADTPSCEFGVIPVGGKVIVKVVARVLTPTEGMAASLGFCTLSEDASTNDPNPSNNCMTASVPITGG